MYVYYHRCVGCGRDVDLCGCGETEMELVRRVASPQEAYMLQLLDDVAYAAHKSLEDRSADAESSKLAHLIIELVGHPRDDRQPGPTARLSGLVRRCICCAVDHIADPAIRRIVERMRDRHRGDE